MTVEVAQPQQHHLDKLDIQIVEEESEVREDEGHLSASAPSTATEHPLENAWTL